MPTYSYRDLARVCAALGLQRKSTKTGEAWLGVSSLSRRPVFLVIHQHAAARDVPAGLFVKYVSGLGFLDPHEFRMYLKDRV